jgi:predicted MPP superfamily phosphohydrolase
MLQTLGQQAPQGVFSILMYHEPTLLETAAQVGVDLYLAGHTHGGQSPGIVRWLLPLFGHPLFKYIAGRYMIAPTTLYVSRGLGMEGMPVPRMRFHCHPEIVVFDIAAP